MSREKIYNNAEGLLEVYKDLWLPKMVRYDDMGEDGIASEVVRKKIFKDDAANSDAEATSLFGVYGTKENQNRKNPKRSRSVRTTPHNMISDLQYVLILPAAGDIMNAQGGKKVTGYTLENIVLEYKQQV
jgi:hypothetical protein